VAGTAINIKKDLDIPKGMRCSVRVLEQGLLLQKRVRITNDNHTYGTTDESRENSG
jgi:hypothetical protein